MIPGKLFLVTLRADESEFQQRAFICSQYRSQNLLSDSAETTI